MSPGLSPLLRSVAPWASLSRTFCRALRDRGDRGVAPAPQMQRTAVASGQGHEVTRAALKSGLRVDWTAWPWRVDGLPFERRPSLGRLEDAAQNTNAGKK